MRGTAAELAERFAEPPKGEITLVRRAAGARRAVDAGAARCGRAELVAAGAPRRAAAEVVARLTASPKRPLSGISVTTL